MDSWNQQQRGYQQGQQPGQQQQYYAQQQAQAQQQGQRGYAPTQQKAQVPQVNSDRTVFFLYTYLHPTLFIFAFCLSLTIP